MLLGKKKHQVWCDTSALYGVDVFRVEHRDYERYLALYLNRVRSSCRQGHPIELGICAALGQHINKKMRLTWYLALAESEDEARFLYEKSRVN